MTLKPDVSGVVVAWLWHGDGVAVPVDWQWCRGGVVRFMCSLGWWRGGGCGSGVIVAWHGVVWDIPREKKIITTTYVLSLYFYMIYLKTM